MGFLLASGIRVLFMDLRTIFDIRFYDLVMGNNFYRPDIWSCLMNEFRVSTRSEYLFQ